MCFGISIKYLVCSNHEHNVYLKISIIMEVYCICPECKRKIFLHKEEIEKYKKGFIVIIPCYDCGIGFDLQKGIHERNIKQ